MRELPTKAVFFVAALPVVMRAARRLVRLNRHCDLQELADRLRLVAPWRDSYLANPHYLDASVSRLVKVLPPRGFGPCIKRSFLLLDLWSRCGLEPKIHIGTQKRDGEHHFHAWVTVPESSNSPSIPCSGNGASEYVEIWSY